jgi:hypothetical protein
MQHTFTHKQYTQHRTEHITIKTIGKCGLCPVFASYTVAFLIQLRKRHGKTSVRVDFRQPAAAKM